MNFFHYKPSFQIIGEDFIFVIVIVDLCTNKIFTNKRYLTVIPFTLYFCRCPNSKEYFAQLLIPKYGDASPCSYVFTKDNWSRPIRVPLMANSDLLVDKTQQVKVDIVAEKFVDNIMTLSRSIKDYQVSVTLSVILC